MIYYYNTIAKDYTEVSNLSEMKTRLTSSGSTLFEQAGYQIIDTQDVYQTIEFNTWANQIHTFQIWCEDIMETSDYRKITHTAKSNGGTVQKLMINFDNIIFFKKENKTIANYKNDLICFFAEKMQR